ncbi:hypothetical protein ACXN5S_01975 [Pseudoroseicyclus sp. H15]
MAPMPSPTPPRGLSLPEFRRIGHGGLGDGHNNYAHSMAWFKGRLYLGTTRSNMCMLKMQSSYSGMPLEVWPVDCPDTMDGLYKLDRRPQIWAYDPAAGTWEMKLRAPMIEGTDGNPAPREIGYRSMAVFKAPGDAQEALYISSWSPGRSHGGLILKSTDGETFEPITRYGITDPPFSTTRSLTPFKGKIHFAPTARRGTDGSQQNATGDAAVFAGDTTDPDGWVLVNEPGFGDPGNLGVFTLATANGQLYASTLNISGMQLWATDGEGGVPYRWRKVFDQGAGRGPLNQAAASMIEFDGALYVGTGIQGGGIDRVNNIGPAAAEIIRVWPDDSYDVVVGDKTDDGRAPISGLRAGFGNFFNGYLWAMGVHEGWLYAGTFDWSINLRWAHQREAPPAVRRLIEEVGPERIIANEGGADLWRSADGENWMPVTKRGFGNAYNWGIRNLVSTPYGLFTGTANVFGPRVAVRAEGGGWEYQDNPDGGLEVWLANHAPVAAEPAERIEAPA